MKELALKIGDRIRELRNKKKVTQEELAYCVSTHYSHISRIERGVSIPSLVLLVSILRELNVSLEEFFSTVDPNIKDKNESYVEIIKLLNDRSMEEHDHLLKIIKEILIMQDENVKK
ncbi:helix-turn-helix domain-containing protein [Bacillus sp. Marseille-P3661]|uniref:helix-turn-helix domain-containing protein n=1 Tax=Bacillus sp. Marseille-P3661 TaxID=1936234 RepID=UPI000C861BD0|nr:helix-turn-helix transcriptional regulator [Bacillus sp. Marseille-P3661]